MTLAEMQFQTPDLRLAERGDLHVADGLPILLLDLLVKDSKRTVTFVA
jgi:hypothetical protein